MNKASYITNIIARLRELLPGSTAEPAPPPPPLWHQRKVKGIPVAVVGLATPLVLFLLERVFRLLAKRST